ncbi:MAG: hypothetical protein JNJ77_15380 [Planctomycetia bacterium]|nr:hypothetical protein [Planctomycetia bacterium]
MQNTTPRFSIQYELTEEIVRQEGVDLMEFRLSRLKQKYPEWGTAKPLLLLGLAAVQLVVAMGLLIWISDGKDIIMTTLLVLGGIALVVLLYKASFYAMPFLGRWLMRWQSDRYLRSQEHRRIEWRLYDDRLETDSAAIQRNIPWSDIMGTAQVGQSIVLSLKSRQELVMPRSVLSKDAQTFLQQHTISQEN